MTRSVSIDRELPHPPEKVWRVLTESGLIEEWLMKTTFEPVVGREFEFRTEPMPHWDGVVKGEVLEVEPESRLSYRWEAGDNLRTVVTWTLEPTEIGTMLRMRQSGFTDADEHNYRGAQYGWVKFLGMLDDVLENIK